MTKKIYSTDKAPSAIGAYSQSVRSGNLLFISGQIPLVPETMVEDAGDIEAKIRRVFENIKAICEAADGELDDIVKLTVLLIDMQDFPVVNKVMAEYFTEPYPARAAYGVASLPKGVPVEIEAIMQVGE